MAKSRDAFRTISEVSDWLATPAHVLRFWESRFSQIKPVKRAGGRRYYRPNDMLLLGGIKRLLHDDGITIKGVQKILREKGLKYVSSLSLDGIDDTPDQPVGAAAEQTKEETPIEAILEEAAEDSEIRAENQADELDDPIIEDVSPEGEPVSDPVGISVFADKPDKVEEPSEPRSAEIPVFVAETEIHEDRISALYHRLEALRNRMHAEMHPG